MSDHSIRFGVGDPLGRRSSEWLVAWKSKTSDVYIATRTLGGTLKASIHQSGRCHVRAPDPGAWRSPGDPPRYLEEWNIDTQANFAFPFAVVLPESDLRAGEWKKHRDKGTIWLKVQKEKSKEVAVFLVRSDSDHKQALSRCGWHDILLDTKLVDGRRLIVVGGESSAHAERQEELAHIRNRARTLLESSSTAAANPRMLLVACDEKGTRRFVEVAVNEEA